MRDDICYYAQIIDTYAPCIVGSSKWNNIINMENHCATTDRKVWSKKILSISDEAFILLCLINYGKRWFAELVKTEKMQIGTWTDEDNNNLPPPLYTFSRNKGAHDNGGGCGWSQVGMRKYDELYMAIKNDRKKSTTPTFNQKLLKMFLSRRKKESGRGVRKQFDDKGKKRPHKCMDVFDDSSDEEDDNYSRHLAPELVYSEVKVEAV
ncbi:hypothetical protein MHU86_11079 [Fragilaria crotonensis]|nr:hypothetical protein MHU86_11079 [Fragilaria crotonensis]